MVADWRSAFGLSASVISTLRHRDTRRFCTRNSFFRLIDRDHPPFFFLVSESEVSEALSLSSSAFLERCVALRTLCGFEPQRFPSTSISRVCALILRPLVLPFNWGEVCICCSYQMHSVHIFHRGNILSVSVPSALNQSFMTTVHFHRCLLLPLAPLPPSMRMPQRRLCSK